MKKLRCNVSGCSSDSLIKLAVKSGFAVSQGSGHCKVFYQDSRLITTIPRHNRIKRFTAKSIIESFNRFGANIEIC